MEIAITCQPKSFVDRVWLVLAIPRERGDLRCSLENRQLLLGQPSLNEGRFLQILH